MDHALKVSMPEEGAGNPLHEGAAPEPPSPGLCPAPGEHCTPKLLQEPLQEQRRDRRGEAVGSPGRRQDIYTPG